MESLRVPNLDRNGYIRTIEWDMMNKYKFFPLSMLSSFSVRCMLYPFTVIKTRIQIQKHSEAYRGTFDAFQKIFKYEGKVTSNNFFIRYGSFHYIQYQCV